MRGWFLILVVLSGGCESCTTNNGLTTNNLPDFERSDIGLSTRDVGTVTFTTAEDVFEAVDPFIGTGGLGFAYAAMTPAAQVPFGFVKLGPDTTAANTHPSSLHHFSGYYFDDPDVRGFSHTHFVGTGAADYGNLRVLPSQLATIQNATPGFAYEANDKTREMAEPGFYETSLPDVGVRVELTATQRVGVHRYTFENADNAISFDVTSSVTDNGVVDSYVDITATTIDGSVTYGGPLTGRTQPFTLYFYGAWDTPAAEFYTWNETGFLPGETNAIGPTVGGVLSFPQSGTIEMKVGVSFISIEKARNAVNATDDFEVVREDAKQLWLEKLSRIKVAGGTSSERTIFFTALYNTYRMPTQIDEDGEYATISGEVKPTNHRHFTDLSLWDTYRTLHPWFTVFDPEAERDVLNSLLRSAADGGMIPRWPAALSYSGAMEGTSADILFAEGALKEIDGVDYQTAYAYSRETATSAPAPNIGYGGREGIDAYLELGWVPADEFSGGASNVLEYSVDDFALANLAQFLGEEDDATMFRDRATWYQNIWDTETGFFRPRNRDGAFVEPFNPTSYSERSGDYTEGSAWHWLFYVPHDGSGLVELMGGAATFNDRLTEFMENAKLFNGDKTQLLLPDGYYWHTNQPSLHAPYLFASTENFRQLSYWIEQIREFGYSTEPDGLVGNDDGGTLSAWYLLSACGFYPVVGSDRYIPSPPVFDEMEIALQNGETLRIVRHDGERFAVAVEQQEKRELLHREFALGGQLDFFVPQ